MTRAYLIRPRADRDLDEHADYLLGQASLETAQRFLDSARETFALLASQPHIGWPAHINHSHLPDLRVFRIAGFERILILYLPRPDGIEVLRAVHGSRNIRALFRRREELG